MYSMGGLAQYAVVPLSALTRIPAGLDPETACILGCSGLTSYSAVFRAGQVAPGDAVAIVGVGGIGSSIIPMALSAGATTIVAANGNIKVSDLQGLLNAETRFGSVRAERVRGNVTVKGSNGSITLNEISGGVNVRTSFGSAFVDGVGGAVDVQNENGAVSVSGIRGSGCHPVSLRTSFSSIKVALPENAGYNVSARTSFGRINTDIPVTSTGSVGESLTGTIGKGGCRLDLVNSNGNITITR
jgi:threonine dehydrogenase-like Zn-dependent dehydrogenase